MFRRLRKRLSYANVTASVALFVALSTGGAYAANTIGSSDIIDGQVNSADVKDQSLTTFDVSTFLGADVVDGTLTGADVADNSLTNADVKDLGNGDFLTGSVDSRVATDNSLTGTDINESTLNMPPTTTATFADASNVALNSSLTKVASKNLPAGSWAISATANAYAGYPNAAGGWSDLNCELRNGTSYIGGATDRRNVEDTQITKRSLSMNGGAQVPAGGGEVSLWCSTQTLGDEGIDTAQMMMIRLDGFS